MYLPFSSFRQNIDFSLTLSKIVCVCTQSIYVFPKHFFLDIYVYKDILGTPTINTSSSPAL